MIGQQASRAGRMTAEAQAIDTHASHAPRAPGVPETHRSASRPGAFASPASAARLESLREACLNLWRDTPAELPRLGANAGWLRRWDNARATARIIDEIGGRLRGYPTEPAAQSHWRDTLRRAVLDFGEARLGWPAGYRRLVLADAFYDTAAAFAREARSFDPALSLDDLGQALRNVWVANSLQLLTARPVRLTPALFAYSMLYPATDNVLDAADLPSPAKQAFGDRLGERLTGGRPAPRNAAEATVWHLVGVLERDCPRSTHPAVWVGVQAIHRAQVASLRQQRDSLSEAELLELSVAKGGASVLADLYIIARDAPPAAERLAFCYGAFLQMLDDLQDVDADLAAGHQTLFTRAAARGPLDALAVRLAQFVDVVLERHAGACTGGDMDTIDLIRHNCHALIVGVMARTPHRFSSGLRRRVERQWPVTLRAMRRLLGRAGHRLDTTRAHLQQQHDVASPLELLLDGAMIPVTDLGHSS